MNVTGAKTWPISKIKPYSKNPRRHSDGQIAKIVQSIEEFGWTIPLLVTAKGELIAGHGRLLAARKLGMKTVPVKLTHSLRISPRLRSEHTESRIIDSLS